MYATMSLPGRCDAAHHAVPPAAHAVKHAGTEPASCPPAAHDPDRARHIEAWKARFVWRRTVAFIAAAFDVSPQSVHAWLKKADGYPETAAIRGTDTYRRTQGKPAK